MDFRTQDLVRYFLAAGGTIVDDEQAMCLVYEEDNTLIERVYTAFELADQAFIASDVRRNTPALYLKDENQRTVFFASAEDTLTCCEWDDEEEEWQEVELSGSEMLAMHAQSRLSGLLIGDGQVVFFQDQSGLLRGISIRDSVYESLGRVPAEPLLGTPQYILLSEDGHELYIFYIGIDKSVHFQVLDLKTGKWNAHTLPGLNCAHLVRNFIIIPMGDMMFEMCALVEDRLVRVDKAGITMELGTVEKGHFTAISREECVIESFALMKRAISGARGMIRKWS